MPEACFNIRHESESKQSRNVTFNFQLRHQITAITQAGQNKRDPERKHETDLHPLQIR